MEAAAVAGGVRLLASAASAAASNTLLRKLALMYWYLLATGYFAWWAVAPQPPGRRRLLRSLPLVLGSLALPLLLDTAAPGEQILTTPIAAIFSLSAFKLLAFSFGRGPLAAMPLTASQFAGVMQLPIVPSEVFRVSGGARVADAGSAGDLLRSYGWNILAALTVSWVLALPGLPVLARHWLYTLESCVFLTAVFNLLGAGAAALLRLKVAPTFNKPWLSSSLADFWARRWNLTTTYMMRSMVYEPIMEGRLVVADHDVAAAAAACSRSSSQAKPSAGEAADDSTEGPAGKDGGRHSSLLAHQVAAEPTGLDGNGRSISTLRQDNTLSSATDAAAASIQSRLRSRKLDKAELLPSTDVAAPGGRANVGGAAAESSDAKESALRHKSDASVVNSVPSRRQGDGGGSLLRRYVALQATFLFSGLWHIAMFWYMTRIFSWRWFVFFPIWAPALVAESALRRWLRCRVPQRVRALLMPHALQVVLTNLLLIVVARPLFFGPTDDTGFAESTLALGQQAGAALLRYSTTFARRAAETWVVAMGSGGPGATPLLRALEVWADAAGVKKL